MIYLLEDDESIRKFVIYALNNSGLRAEGFEQPSLFWSAMKTELPQLILLDIMLPDEDGLSILKKLRENKETKKTPVIMLTAKGTEYDKVIGLDAGADDYVAKPFGIMELLSRIKALLRRCEDEPDKKEFRLGNLYVNQTKHIVSADGAEIALSFKEFELLCLLLSNRGAVQTRDAILRKIWGYDFDGENRTVDVHINTLRSKLGRYGDMIETVRGIGYKISEQSEATEL